MKTNSTKFFSLLFVETILIYSEGVISNSDIRTNFRKSCPDISIDSLKWMMYSLSFEQKARHYKYDYYPELGIPECDLRLYFKDTSLIDTIVYYFSFFKGKEEDKYIPKSFYRTGIGFSCKTKGFFPVSNHFFPKYLEGCSNYENLFNEQEKKFLNFLKSYNGNLSPWLKQEAVKRRILDN
jgi:hypothetical protein